MTKARDTANLTGSGVGLSLLDIDAGTDIGAALVDADLMIVDDGAGGTNRKATMSRLATYMGTKIGGGMEFIASSGAISSAASSTFTQLDSSKYDSYVFYFLRVLPATDNVRLICQTKPSGGSFASSNGDYHFDGATDSTGLIASHHGAGNDLHGVNGQFFLYTPHVSSSYTFGASQTVTMNDGTDSVQMGGATDISSSVRLATESVAEVKFLFTSGNIASGEITMFGVVNS